MTSTIEVMPDSMLTMDQKVEKWCAQLITSLQFDYDSQYPKGRVKFYLRTGRKYHKIVEQNGGVHCFINKTTGEVFKPASYNSPAKGVRYDMRIINERNMLLSQADWAGSYLYLRG